MTYRADALVTFAVYFEPLDFPVPGCFVARMFLGVDPFICHRAMSLDRCREWIESWRPGSTLLMPDPADDPTVVEVWIA